MASKEALERALAGAIPTEPPMAEPAMDESGGYDESIKEIAMALEGVAESFPDKAENLIPIIEELKALCAPENSSKQEPVIPE